MNPHSRIAVATFVLAMGALASRAAVARPGAEGTCVPVATLEEQVFGPSDQEPCADGPACTRSRWSAPGRARSRNSIASSIRATLGLCR